MTVDVENQAGGDDGVDPATSMRCRSPQAPKQLGRRSGCGRSTVDTPAGADAAVAADGDRPPGDAGGDAGSGGVPLRRDRGELPVADAVRRTRSWCHRCSCRARRTGPTWTDLGTLVPPTAPTIVEQFDQRRADSSGRPRSGGRTRRAATTVYAASSGSRSVTDGACIGDGDAGGPDGPGRDQQSPDRRSPRRAAGRPRRSTAASTRPRCGEGAGREQRTVAPTSAEYQSSFPADLLPQRHRG